MAILLWLLAFNAHALDPDKAFRHYVIDQWGIEDGLPQLSVLSITQDTTGYLWLTTQNGVARFDGVRFRVFNVENTPALRANIIDKTHLAADGSLWFGSNRGLTRYAGGEWAGIDLIPGKDVAIGALLNDIDGRVLVGTENGLFRVDGQSVEAPVLPGVAVHSLARIGSTVYAGSNGEVIELKASRSRSIAIPGAADAPAVMALLPTPEGLLAGTRRGLFQRSGDGWVIPPWAQPLAMHRIEALFRDNDANVWIGTTQGLYRYHPRLGLEHCLTAQLGDNAWISSFFEDREGNLWVGSLTHSLTRVWNGWVARLSLEEGLSDAFVWSVLSDDSGRVWIGTNTGIEEMSPNGAVRLLTSTRELPDSSAYDLYRTQNGDLLVGTRAGLARWDGHTLSRDPIWEPIAQSAIRAIIEETPGQLWIGTDQGLYVQSEGSLARIGPEQGLTESRVRALAQSQHGEIWVGTERGVFRGINGRYRRLDQPPELTPALITAIVPWLGNRFLITSMDAGLFIGAAGDFRQLTTTDGLPFNSAFAAIADGGWVYVSSPEGVYRITESDLDHFHRQGGRVEADMVVQTGSQHPGALRARCCNGGAQARITRANGSLWLPTLEGVLRLDTGKIRRSALPPPAVAESVEHLGVTYEGQGPFRLDGSSGDVAIQFSGLALQDPIGLRFRYRLIGYDSRWRSAGERRTVYYTNLAPGSYRFEAVASSSSGLLSPEPAQLRFELVPPFYRAWWFLALMALIGLCLVALGWSGYRRRVQARERALERQIQQRTAELDRANERLRSANRALLEESQTDALTGLRNRRYLARYMAEWRLDANDDRPQRLAFVLIDLDHFKRINDVHGHLAGDEVLRQLAEVLSEFTGNEGFPLRWGGEEFMLVLAAESITDPEQFCESLRQRIGSKAFEHSTNQRSHVSASIGYALFPALADRSDANDWNLSLELADAGLYLIKSGGRNGWAIVQARARAGAAAFSGGVTGRLDQLEREGLIQIDTGPRRRVGDPH
ncbi:MAG: diguanylate cyclase [Lysobacterales bacterium]